LAWSSWRTVEREDSSAGTEAGSEARTVRMSRFLMG
jgi:hypothetical protein